MHDILIKDLAVARMNKLFPYPGYNYYVWKQYSMYQETVDAEIILH